MECVKYISSIFVSVCENDGVFWMFFIKIGNVVYFVFDVIYDCELLVLLCFFNFVLVMNFLFFSVLVVIVFFCCIVVGVIKLKFEKVKRNRNFFS